MLRHRPRVEPIQDEPPQPLARRPQLLAVGQAFGKTPQLVIPAEASRVREGDPAAEESLNG